jgi:hypothetical protein
MAKTPKPKITLDIEDPVAEGVGKSLEDRYNPPPERPFINEVSPNMSWRESLPGTLQRLWQGTDPKVPFGDNMVTFQRWLQYQELQKTGESLSWEDFLKDKGRFDGDLNDPRWNKQDAQTSNVPVSCFPANTPIQTSLTSTTLISDLRVGDVVLAFDPHAELGRGALVPRRVTRLFHNTTTEWIKLTWLDPVTGEARELVATPGHEMLDKFGRFTRLDALVQGNTCEIILSSGDCIMAQAERLVYSAATADMFERAYNFEVEDLHTFVAGQFSAVANDNMLPFALTA